MSSNPLLPSGTHTHIVQNIRNYNLNANDPPLPTDDAGDGYYNGSVWIDTDALPQPQAYICVDATVNQAIWVPIGDNNVQVPINRTLFVDQQFGTIAGVPEDMLRPYSTLALALAAATPNNGDVIYVQPGTYVVDAPLVLKDGVNWYFSEGANVQTSATLTTIFDDSNGPVNCTIAGYAAFTIVDGANSVLQTTNANRISFTAQRIRSESESTVALFDLSATTAGTQGQYQINVESVVQLLVPPVKTEHIVVAIGSLPSNASIINVQYNGQTIDGLGIVHALSGDGVADMTVQSIESGETGIDGNDIAVGALFYNATDAYEINATSQTVVSVSGTQIIVAQNTTTLPQSPKIALTAQSITARGGIVYAEGLDNTADINTQPRIEVSANDILVTEGTVPLINSIYPVYCESAAVVVRATTFLNDRTTDTLYNFTVNDLGALLLDVTYIALIAGKAFDVSNLNPSTNVTTLIVDAINIFAAESLLRSDNACRTSIKANQIVCRTTIVGQSAVLTQGVATQPPPLSARIATTVIVADLLLLNAIGTDGSDTGRASMIDHRTGVLDLRAERYGVNGSFYNAIRIGPGMQINNVRVGLCGIIATESRFLFLNGGPGADQTVCTIDCDLIGCGLGVAGATNIAAIDALYGQLEGSLASVVLAGDSTCSCVLLRGQSNYTVQTGRLYVNGGSAVALNVQDASSVIADIGIMVTENGSIVRFASSSDRSIVQFQQMRCGDTTEPLQFLGSGDVWMTGLDIQTGTSTNLVHISNSSSVSLAVESVSSEAADTLFLVDTSGFLYFTSQQVTGDNISTAAIHGNGANLIRFSSELLNVESALASADFFRLESTAYCAITCQTLNCLEIAALLRATSTGVSSSAHLQFDSFYCDAVQRLVYAANNAQVFVSFQSFIANALSSDAFTALDNGTRVQIDGSSLVCNGKFNSPNIFLVGPGTALLTANIPVIALGGNITASLIACSGAGTAILETQKFTGGDMIRLISAQSQDSIVSVSIDSLVVENGTTQALVFVDQATLRITGKQWRFNNPVLQTLFHARVNGTLQVGLNLLEALNPCAHVLHTEQSARVRFEADVIDINGSTTGAFLLTDQESTSIRTERLRVAKTLPVFRL